MTDTVRKATYGLLSRTILSSLADEHISKERIEGFCLYMHWGIINQFPSAVLPVHELTEVILQWISLRHPEIPVPETIAALKTLYYSKKDWLWSLDQKLNSPAPGLPGYAAWAQHCGELLQQDASLSTCLQLMLVLKDSVPLTFTDTFTAVYMINETMLRR